MKKICKLTVEVEQQRSLVSAPPSAMAKEQAKELAKKNGAQTFVVFGSSSVQ